MNYRRRIKRAELLAMVLPDVEAHYTELRAWHKKLVPHLYERYESRKPSPIRRP